MKLEVELKDEKVNSLKRELEDLTFTGKTEEEVASLKKAKHDLELRVKDQVNYIIITLYLFNLNFIQALLI